MKLEGHPLVVLSSTECMALCERALPLALQLRPAGKGGGIAVRPQPRRSDPAPAHSCVTGVGSAGWENGSGERRQGGAGGPGEWHEQVRRDGEGSGRWSESPWGHEKKTTKGDG